MDDPNESVQSLVARLQATGSPREEDFRRLFDLFYPRVVHFFARRGFPPQDCLDLTQETFLGIYKGIATFRRDSRFETWLFTIAANAWRKRLRWGVAGKREGQEVALEPTGHEPPAPESPADAEMLRKERSRRLREAVETLPEQMRRCLVLRVYQEMKYREIAALLRLSPETVKVHLFQARKRLREELGPYFADAVPEDEAET
jgi:RNA polymerase sigma-70 factor, ECF subfamily